MEALTHFHDKYEIIIWITSISTAPIFRKYNRWKSFKLQLKEKHNKTGYRNNGT